MAAGLSDHMGSLLGTDKIGDSSLIPASVQGDRIHLSPEKPGLVRPQKPALPQRFAGTALGAPKTAVNRLLHQGLRRIGVGVQRGVFKTVTLIRSFGGMGAN